MTVEWHGNEAKRQVRSAAARAISRAAIVVQRRAKELLSTSGTGVQGAGGIEPSKQGTKKKRIYDAFPSAAGDPPALQTGRLRASVTHEVDDATLTARVGTNVEYGKYLELGTRRGLAPRPWLRRALSEVSGQINSILSGLDRK